MKIKYDEFLYKHFTCVITARDGRLCFQLVCLSTVSHKSLQLPTGISSSWLGLGQGTLIPPCHESKCCYAVGSAPLAVIQEVFNPDYFIIHKKCLTQYALFFPQGEEDGVRLRLSQVFWFHHNSDTIGKILKCPSQIHSMFTNIFYTLERSLQSLNQH